MAQNHRKDQLAMEPPRKVQSTLVQSPLPLSNMGTTRCSGKFSIMPYRSRPQDATSGGYHCNQLWRAATKAPNIASTTSTTLPPIYKPFRPLAPVNAAQTAIKTRAYRCTMHIGQGSSPSTCCKYRPKA